MMFAIGENVRILIPNGNNPYDGRWDMLCDVGDIGLVTQLSQKYHDRLKKGSFVCTVRPLTKGNAQWVPASAIEKLLIGDEKLEDWL